MRRNAESTTASVACLLLLVIHLADDTVRGMVPPAGPVLVYAAIASGLLLWGVLSLGDRRSGLFVRLLISIFAIAMPILHTRGAGVTTIAKSPGGLFFVFTILALGMLGAFSLILSIHALISWRSEPPGQSAVS